MKHSLDPSKLYIKPLHPDQIFISLDKLNFFLYHNIKPLWNINGRKQIVNTCQEQLFLQVII